ncbi:SRPBCC family protein [Microbacterium hibisci]|uniref:SRPBCC family protein n=1 Tax=Microbacterium hibisci TaxID=2036000 RepID=UPI0019414494|nr:SRPBCC domain-containing protein [Microbacterium hibisci]
MKTPSFTLTREFAAGPEAVWSAWTDPVLMSRWMHPAGVTTPLESVSSDPVVGGSYAYTMVDESGTEYPTAGKYLELVRPSRIVCTWGPAGDPAAASRLTVELEPTAIGTRMTFTCGVEAAPGDDVHDGWAEALDSLAATLGTPVR